MSALFRKSGVPIVDADILSRLAVRPGSDGLAQVAQTFGLQILGEDGQLDRKRMGDLVFSNTSMRESLNAILHPIVGQMARDEFTRLKAEGIDLAGYDCPLLFELGLHEEFRPTVVVYATEEQQVARIMARNNLSEDKARERVASQMALSDKARAADLVIENTGSKQDLRSKMPALLADIRRVKTSA